MPAPCDGRRSINYVINKFMDANPLTIVYKPITLLNPSEYNPRKHTKVQTEQLADSITRFGMIDPLICNNSVGRENIVIGGHFRLEVAKSLGLTEVPVVYVTISDIEKEKELNLRLNKNTGEFDFDKLKSFDLDLLLDIGFNHKEVDAIWNKPPVQGKLDFAEEAKAITNPTTKLGDVILLGQHRLICGDSTKPETLERLFGTNRASMIISDPIYNISVDYNKGIGGKQSYGGTVDDNKSDAEYKEFLRLSLVVALTVTHLDAHIFYWCDQVYIWIIQTLYREFGIVNKRVCLWVKNGHNPTPGVAFNKCYEPCVYGTLGKPRLTKAITKLTEVMNSELGTGNEMMGSVKDQVDLWAEKRLPGSEYEHSTMKPIELYEKAIRRCSKRGEIILDSFSGSGTTIMAGERLKRRVFAVEIEPAFCDLAIRRYEAETGTKVIIIPAHEEVPQDEAALGATS